jgi:hypothetical protein
MSKAGMGAGLAGQSDVDHFLSLCFYCRRYQPLQLGKLFVLSFLVRAQTISL